MTEPEVRKLVAMLIAAFPHTKANEATAKAYERMLRDLDARAAAAAVEQLMATRNYMPTIAEVRAAVAELQAGPVRAGGEAWGDVLRLVGRYGCYRTPGHDFEVADPIAARCIDALGWRSLCLSENSVADRSRFVDLYDRLAREARTDAVAGALPAVRAMRELRERSGEAAPLAKLIAITDGRSES
jgi:hypothetical protein